MREPGAVALPTLLLLVETLRAGGVDVEYEIVPGGTHTDVAFGFVAFAELRTEESLSWLRDLVDAE